MKKWHYGLLVLLFFGLCWGVYFAFSDLGGKTEPVLKPTSFDKSQEIGAVLFRRLKFSLNTSGSIYLQTTETVPMSTDVWDGFLQTSAEDKFPISLALIDLKYKFDQIKYSKMILEFYKSTEALSQIIEGEALNERRLLLITDTLSEELLAKTQNGAEFYVAQWNGSLADFKQTFDHCVDKTPPRIIAPSNECLLYWISKKYWRKLDRANGPIVAWMDRFGPGKYQLIIWNKSKL